MAGRIPQTFVDELLDRVDLVELIDSRVKLRKSGKNYIACCPFHDEKTPSFSVNADKQFYHCFGCGVSGNAIGFLMEYERRSFPEAIEYLAQLQGMEVPREQGHDDARYKQRQEVHGILDRAARYYQEQLRSHPAAGLAKDYLKGRGLTGQIAQRFGVGYAPPGWDNLLAALGELSPQRQLLLEAGMLAQKEGQDRYYDRFRDRIMFPIRDVRGRVIAFGGRVLNDEKPKYLNSPETELFHKGQELYGLYEAIQENRQLERLLVVEGYMDVVALAQYDIAFVVATLGTAATGHHLEKAFRHVPEVVFCFDGDGAGRRAAQRALEVSLPMLSEGRQVRFLFLPEDEDPDTLVRKEGREAFLDRLKKAAPLSEFLFRVAGDGLDLATPEGRALLTGQALPLITRLPEGAYKIQMKQMLADKAMMDFADIESLAGRQPATLAGKTAAASPGPAAASIKKQPARKQPVRKLELVDIATSLLLQKPDLLSLCEQRHRAALRKLPEASRLLRLIDLIEEHPGSSLNRILGLWQGHHGADDSHLLYELAARETLLDDEGRMAELQDAFTRLEQQANGLQLEQLIDAARRRTLTPEEKQELTRLLEAK